MKLSKVLFGSAVLAALMFGFASCGENEDESNAFDGEEISLSNTDTTKNDNGNKYYRSFAGTKTKHSCFSWTSFEAQMSAPKYCSTSSFAFLLAPEASGMYITSGYFFE